MIIRPPKAQGLVLGGTLFALILGGIVFGVFQLSSGEISPLLGVWTSIIVIGLPLLLMVGYRLFGLISARYVLNRDGFYLYWGFSSEQIPLSVITMIKKGEDINLSIAPRFGFWWPGCVVGHRDVEGLGPVEFFATKTSSGLIVIPLEGRNLAISPPDVDVFQQAFLDVVRLGALEEIPAQSVRPEFFSARLWADLPARFLILTGLVLVISLLGYLAYRAPGLPDRVPFGFDTSGNANPLVPPSQLLLLPLVGGFFWLADFIIGAWLYRNENDQRVAYLVWFTGALLGGLLWGAIIHLLLAV